MPILDRLQGPADLRGLTEPELAQLAGELRETIIRTVAATGGHLGSSLGVVEITLALHRLLESPRDRIVWDTGHQAYAHKLLTGRLDRFHTLRQIDGIGGFPRRSESPHDVMDGGHAGTGLSIAEGLATARDIRHSLERVAVVVGDAALLSGLSLEALNDIGHRQSQLLIVLNDNEMSISPSVGALSKYLSEIKLSVAWQQSKGAYDRVTEQIPVVGPPILELSKRFRQSVVSFAQPGQLFEDLGITYIGVMPGHDLRAARGDVPPGAGAQRPGHRPRAHPEGEGLPAGGDRPGLVPRRGPAADDPRAADGHARPCRHPRRQRRRDGLERGGRLAGHRVARCRRGCAAVRVRPCRPPHARAQHRGPGGAQRDPGRATRRRRRTTPRSSPRSCSRSAPRTAGSWGSPRACPRAPASRSSRPRTRTGSSTSASRSSTP